MLLYKIATFNDVNEFLVNIAKTRGKLGKGGVPNYKAAARLVLQDWNCGKIPFYTLPPQDQTFHVATTIATSWAKEFDIDNIAQVEKVNVILTLPTIIQQVDQFIAVGESQMNSAKVIEVDDKEDAIDAMQDDDDSDASNDKSDQNDSDDDMSYQASETPSTSNKSQVKKIQAADSINPQTNKKKQIKTKKEKKDKKRTQKIALQSLQGLAINDNDAYDFATDFKPDEGQLINEIASQYGGNNLYSGLETLEDEEYGEASSDDDGTGEQIPDEEEEMDQ